MVSTPVRVSRVDADGIRLWGLGDRVLDVTFDDQRVWSFWLERDTERALPARRAVNWPRNLSQFMHGATRVVIREHVTGRVLFEAERSFGDGGGRITVVNALGAPLGIDKSGRLVPTFESRTPEQVKPLLDAIDEVLGALAAAGVEAFPAYGTLLGAVREQRLLGHDSDADLGYVSRLRRPVDVTLESFRLQRTLNDRGYRTRRYSGAAFKVDVIESDGVVRTLDVFGGFFDDDEKLYLMGEVGHPFRESWIFPLGTCTLEGRTLPAPARPEHLLEAMYGPGWPVPDPAYKFETPERVVRQLDGWFRGTRPNRSFWDRRYSTARTTLPSRTLPTALARAVVEREGGVPERVVDLGCGRGADALWFARHGARVLGFDVAPAGAQAAAAAATEEGHDLRVRPLNLNEWRSVFGQAARVVGEPGPRTVLARHLADSVTPFARDAMARFAAMLLRDGGRLYLEVWTGEGKRPAPRVVPIDLHRIRRLLERHGARIVSVEELPVAADGGWPRHSVGRLVAQWA